MTGMVGSVSAPPSDCCCATREAKALAALLLCHLGADTKPPLRPDKPLAHLPAWLSEEGDSERGGEIAQAQRGWASGLGGRTGMGISVCVCL